MSRHRFTGEGGEEVDVGWDEQSGTFFAQVWPTSVAAGGPEPEDAVRYVAGEDMFDVMESATLVARLAREGIAVPDEVRDLLAVDDDPARTVGSALDRVLKNAAMRLDRPGSRGSLHVEVRRDFEEAARARLSRTPVARPVGSGGAVRGYSSSYGFVGEHATYDEDVGFGYQTRWKVGWDDSEFTFTAESHQEYFGGDGELLGESEQEPLPVVGAWYFDVLRSTDLVEQLAEMGLAVPEDVRNSLAADDVRAGVVAAEYEKARARHPDPSASHAPNELYHQVRRTLDRDDRIQSLRDQLSGPEVRDVAGRDVLGGAEASWELRHLDGPVEQEPPEYGSPDNELGR